MEVDYQRALELELPAHNLEFAREVEIPIYYKGHKITTRRLDFDIESYALETKAKHDFEPEDFMQTLLYMKQGGYRVGLLVNFGRDKIQVKRFVNNQPPPDSVGASG